MKYLFYDLENATQRGGKAKICEFGYVITDENFSVLEKNNFIINPNIRNDEWDYMVVKNILTRPKKAYELNFKFPYYYEKIVNVFNKVDLVFGHTLAGDAKSINDELERYSLKPINYSFYDVKDIYKLVMNVEDNLSVTKLMDVLGLTGDEKTHDALADAYNTMLILKELLILSKDNMEGLLNKCLLILDKSENLVVESIHNRQLKKEAEILEAINGTGTNEMKNNSANRTAFYAFMKNVRPNRVGTNKLRGKYICISLNYEIHHYRQMLNIVQLIKNEGGKYVSKVTGCNIFVSFDELLEDGTINECKRLNYVKESNLDGHIKVYSFNEFLSLLGITEEELNNLPMVNLDCIKM